MIPEIISELFYLLPVCSFPNTPWKHMARCDSVYPSSLKFYLLKASEKGLTPPGRGQECPLAAQTTWKSYSAFVPVGAIDFIC